MKKSAACIRYFLVLVSEALEKGGKQTICTNDLPSENVSVINLQTLKRMLISAQNAPFYF